MAVRGRKPKPTAAKKASGITRKDRLNEDEPQPDPRVPTCPKGLGELARAEWKRVAAEMAELGMLTNLDRAALAGYCRAYETMVRAEESVQAYYKEHGTQIMQTEKGGLMQHPGIGIANRASEIMDRFAGSLGLNPSARTRIRAPQKPKESGWNDYGGPAPKAGPARVNSGIRRGK